MHSVHCYLLKTQRYRTVYLGRELRLALQLHNSNRNRVFRLERQLARKHFVKNNANRINIGFFIGALASCLFGAYIMNRAYRLICNGALLASCKAGYAEIGNLYGAVRQNHNILRLNVPVNNALIVRVLKTLKYLNCKMHRVLPPETALVLYIFLKGYTVDIFHNDILNQIAEAYVVNLYDIRVRKHCDRLGFVFKAAHKLFVRNKLFL